MGWGRAVVDVNALAQILSIRNGVWAAAALIALGVFRLWHALPAIMERLNERRRDTAAERAADWTRLRDRLETVEAKHEKCERDLMAEREQRHKDVSGLRDEIAVERAERMKLQAILDGQGQVRQAAAAAQAEVRADPDKAPVARDRFNGDKEGGN
jgi:superfamily II RNA helicase